MRSKLWCILCLVCLGVSGSKAQTTLNSNPSRVVGQPQLTLSTFSPNLVEGRELYAPQAVAVDTSVSPPILYVADTGNNRVLAWKDAGQFANGARADLVIGQKDMYTTFAQGPGVQGSTSPVGLNSPVALTVDGSGNLYVVDAGNNRILRFPSPFSQNSQPIPDLVLGQPDFNSRSPNQGGGPSAKTIVTQTSLLYRASLALDQQGNLYFADAGNNRVLRYRSSDLTTGNNDPAADIAIGQADLNSRVALALNSKNQTVMDQLNTPAGIAFDAGGRLFVSDLLGRVLVFLPPNFTTGMSATRVMGIVPSADKINTTVMGDPECVFAFGDGVGVVDRFWNRILLFPPYNSWPTDSAVSPEASAIVGASVDSTMKAPVPNNGQPEPSASTFTAPVSAVFVSSLRELFVADTGNHRVLAFPEQSSTFTAASAVLGQGGIGPDDFKYNSPNLIEGREFNFGFSDAGIVIDRNSNPPHLYVADTYNNRVLGFADARKVKPGDKADLVIGQPDMYRSVCNYNFASYADTNPAKPTQSSLCSPTGLVVDSAGNLYVADTGNGRVLRFPQPFANPGPMPPADLVLGQSGFNIKVPTATATTMLAPYGLAFDSDDRLLVSDFSANRVVLFDKAANGGLFTSGMPAAKVIGQPDFTSAAAGNGDDQLKGPHHISVDSDGRLYVADTGNGRVQIFPPVQTAPAAGAHALALSISGLRNPHAVDVSLQTGEIWVADTDNFRILHFPKYDSMLLSGSNAPDAKIQPSPIAPNPLAITLDGFGNLYVADNSNRVAIHFPGMFAVNGANFLLRPLAPGEVASLFPSPGVPFGQTSQDFGGVVPVPTDLADIQVLVNNQPSPLFYVSPGQINFVVPTGAPTSGTSEIDVVQKSTGQILSSTQVPMDVAAPGLFTRGSTMIGQIEYRQIAALNEDDTVNSPSNPEHRGHVISLYATGEGLVPGQPADGVPASGLVRTPDTPRVIIGTDFVDPANIQYSGLAPGLVGLWQINVKIPDTVAPSDSVIVVVVYQNRQSNDPQKFRTTIAVN